jgi:hypothetical protein
MRQAHFLHAVFPVEISSRTMRGTVRKISLPRRLIIDLMRVSMRVPFVSLRRTLNVAPLAEALQTSAERPGWAALFAKAYSLVARDIPVLRTLYIDWPWPHFYELPRSVCMVAIARQWDGEDCVLPHKINAPDEMKLADVDALLRQAKSAPMEEVRAFRRILRVMRLPLPLRRLMWRIGLSVGRQRATFFGSFGITSVTPFGGGELHAISSGPYIISYDVLLPDQTIDVVIRWDHRVTDAEMIANLLTRLEQVLNSEIAAELLANQAQPAPKSVRAVVT